jgi:uncharacterized protein
VTTEPLDRLIVRLQAEDRLLTGFSGGADSALLAFVAHQVLGEKAIAVTAVSASLPERERAAARQFAREHGMAHVEVCTDELGRPEYVRNGGDRCFHCKSALFDALAPLVAITGARVALGTNVDDLSDHRPGHVVARNRGAVFPLVDAGMTKDVVRSVSRKMCLVSADKPAAACLSSRIAYGDSVTPQLLRRIEMAEDVLHALGFPECRVRAHNAGSVARIEVAEPDVDRLVAVRKQLLERLRSAGFDFISVDLAGLRSGSMNVLLRLAPTRLVVK